MGQNKIKRQIEILSAQGSNYMLNAIKADLMAKQIQKEQFGFGLLLGSGIIMPVRNDMEATKLFV